MSIRGSDRRRPAWWAARGPSIIPDFGFRIERTLNTVRPVGPATLDSELRSPEELTARLESEYGPHLAIMDQRLGEALHAAGLDGAVVFAGDEKIVFRDDQAYPFKSEPYFKAWVPLTQAPGSFLRLVPGQRPLLVYKQLEDYWHEPPSDPTGYWTAHFDIRVVRTEDDARKLSGVGPRWVAIGEGAGAAARLGAAGAGSAAGTAAARAKVNDAKFLAHLDYFRATKTRYEVLCMRAAQLMGVRGHQAVAAALGPGVAEFELHQIYCNASQQRENDLPYSSIVALNEHAATLHYQHLRARAPSPLRSLLIDAGAEYNGYAADITRTYSASNGDDFDALIQSMDALQQRVCADVKAGVDFVALHVLTHRLLAAVLREHDLVKCKDDEAVAAGLTRVFLPHGLGHLLGLQVHDAGGRQADTAGKVRKPPPKDPYLRLTRTLEQGFVVTIEPGLYFIPALLRAALAEHEDKLNRAKIERLLPFGGIRVEDDVEVTKDGSKNLTREAFAALADAAPSPRGRSR
jgi:Xaa-Pro dipeptidase